MKKVNGLSLEFSLPLQLSTQYQVALNQYESERTTAVHTREVYRRQFTNRCTGLKPTNRVQIKRKSSVRDLSSSSSPTKTELISARDSKIPPAKRTIVLENVIQSCNLLKSTIKHANRDITSIKRANTQKEVGLIRSTLQQVKLSASKNPKFQSVHETGKPKIWTHNYKQLQRMIANELHEGSLA